MLLLNKKEEHLEAYEDFKRLQTLDYKYGKIIEIWKMDWHIRQKYKKIK